MADLRVLVRALGPAPDANLLHVQFASEANRHSNVTGDGIEPAHFGDHHLPHWIEHARAVHLPDEEIFFRTLRPHIDVETTEAAGQRKDFDHLDEIVFLEIENEVDAPRNVRSHLGGAIRNLVDVLFASAFGQRALAERHPAGTDFLLRLALTLNVGLNQAPGQHVWKIFLIRVGQPVGVCTRFVGNRRLALLLAFLVLFLDDLNVSKIFAGGIVRQAEHTFRHGEELLLDADELDGDVALAATRSNCKVKLLVPIRTELKLVRLLRLTGDSYPAKRLETLFINLDKRLSFELGDLQRSLHFVESIGARRKLLAHLHGLDLLADVVSEAGNALFDFEFGLHLRLGLD